MQNNKYNYVSIEGPDGIGKTTVLKALDKKLKEMNVNFLIVKEPGLTRAGNILREYLLEKERDLETNIDIFVADRILGQKLIIKPAIERNSLVISDRSVVSSLVYQGLMYNDIDNVYARHDNIDFIYPQLTIVGTLPLDICMKRLAGRSGNETNYIDKKGRDYHEQIHRHFENIGNWYKHRFLLVNFNTTIEEIILTIIDKLYGK